MTEKELNNKMIEELEGILQSMKEQRDKLLEAPVTDVLTTDQWNKVIDGKFLCGFWDGNGDDQVSSRAYLVNRTSHQNYTVYTDGHGVPWEHCKPVRELGIKQPHFRGQPPPPELNSDRTLVYYEDGSVHQLSDHNHFDWDDIVAFIEV